MDPVANPDLTYRQQYLDDGFVFVPELLSHDEAIDLLDLLQPALNGELGHVGFGEEGNREIKQGLQQQVGVTKNGPMAELLDHPYCQRSQQWAESLSGYVLQFSYGQIIAKPAHYDAHVQWHQDGYYWRQRDGGDRSISCWVALTDCRPENGSVGYVKGSHKTGVQSHDNAFGKYEFHRAYEVSELNADQIVHAHLKPGDAAFHHSLCIHGSLGNQTDQPRIGIVSHFFPVE